MKELIKELSNAGFAEKEIKEIIEMVKNGNSVDLAIQRVIMRMKENRANANRKGGL